MAHPGRDSTPATPLGTLMPAAFADIARAVANVLSAGYQPTTSLGDPAKPSHLLQPHPRDVVRCQGMHDTEQLVGLRLA
jgi:hypothetical protein